MKGSCKVWWVGTDDIIAIYAAATAAGSHDQTFHRVNFKVVMCNNYYQGYLIQYKLLYLSFQRVFHDLIAIDHRS